MSQIMAPRLNLFVITSFVISTISFNILAIPYQQYQRVTNSEISGSSTQLQERDIITDYLRRQNEFKEYRNRQRKHSDPKLLDDLLEVKCLHGIDAITRECVKFSKSSSS
ncbi:uncharacterized protein MELLADRAFT_123535 [Melampsora larici-populina 98AG31]|uniref:Secreted protein n=1 Tax=Melampsora larici-populina (strain 98AG31 / pathotype 3-4-7) TaxID=747676 RepID=F4SBW2_MELLP|nr:uncharacterized protein MELLADRAFT_123535 [Melampsora larici-populina 98AG31]EGF97873.1 secreted protein [Melampsora larici-populina 98AG31]